MYVHKVHVGGIVAYLANGVMIYDTVPDWKSDAIVDLFNGRGLIMRGLKVSVISEAPIVAAMWRQLIDSLPTRYTDANTVYAYAYTMTGDITYVASSQCKYVVFDTVINPDKTVSGRGILWRSDGRCEQTGIQRYTML